MLSKMKKLRTLPSVDMTGSKGVLIELPELLWRQAKAVDALKNLTAREMVAGLLQLYVWDSKAVPEKESK